MTTVHGRAESTAADLVRLLRESRGLPAGARAALRIGVGLIRWSRRSADRAAAAAAMTPQGDGAAARRARDRARDRAVEARFRAGLR